MSRDFWSKRRAAVVAEERAEQAAIDAAEVAEVEAALEERSDEEILAERNLPDPDTLETPEDIRAFMSEALPQRLKTRALRRLWRLNPVLANLDGLVDYGEDFTDSAMVIENMQTAYQVGKGMLKHIEALAEAEAAKQAAAEDATDEEPEVEDEPAMDASEEEPEIAVVAEAYTAPQADDPYDDPEPEYTPRPRRMTFTFEEQRT
ncbi:MAG: DUF3306 domain-containing protein [Paracoccaceae bacterium]